MERRDKFSSLHPLTQMLCFSYVLIMSMFVMHPVMLFISLASACIYALYLSGTKKMLSLLFAMIPVIILTVAVNMLFNHRGESILFYLSGKPVTREAMYFGFTSSLMLIAVLMWFSCYNAVMTSEKQMYLFGKLLPSFSLMLTMTLRLVPDFIRKINEISNAQKGFGAEKGSSKLKNGMSILSTAVTCALEGAVIRADSMKSRGYGCERRTQYTRFVFKSEDKTVSALLLLFGAVCAYSVIKGAVYCEFYPTFSVNGTSALSITGIFAFILFCNIPMTLNFSEDIKWQVIKSRI
ncbi:MAG: energy-coupling factor transporter transmembrane protein EcfT [Clostridia bacterium]|nr:energy-coupling factor transporter transmembrane protein EcfT [Clostridia bacterium]